MMKRMTYIGVVGSLLLQSTHAVWASGPGTTSADILKIGLGARAIGMGEAYVAQADDVSSLYWNPAGLALMEERQASFEYAPSVQNMTFQNAQVGIPLENGAIGGSLAYQSFGTINGFSTTGQPIGDQSAYSGVATIGGAWLGDQWSVGANLKGVREKLADESANTAAVDLGANVIYPKPVLGGTLRFGAVVQNLGQGIKFDEERDPLPTDWKLGMAAVQMLDSKLNLSLDFGKPRDGDTEVSGGAEYWIAKFLALRAGYVANHTEGSGIRAGIGLRIKGVSFDYAYSGDGDLGMTNRYELSFRFGEPRPILTPEERKILRQAKAAMAAERYEQATLLFDSLINLEPRYKPARRYIKVAMAKLENQQSTMSARQGKSFDPEAAVGSHKPALPDMDDLEQLLNLGSPKGQPKGTKPGTSPTTGGAPSDGTNSGITAPSSDPLLQNGGAN